MAVGTLGWQSISGETIPGAEPRHHTQRTTGLAEFKFAAGVEQIFLFVCSEGIISVGLQFGDGGSMPREFAYELRNLTTFVRSQFLSKVGNQRIPHEPRHTFGKVVLPARHDSYPPHPDTAIVY